MPVLADKVEHVIVLMLENRSFDHRLGFVPGVGELAPRAAARMAAKNVAAPANDLAAQALLALGRDDLLV